MCNIAATPRERKAQAKPISSPPTSSAAELDDDESRDDHKHGDSFLITRVLSVEKYGASHRCLVERNSSPPTTTWVDINELDEAALLGLFDGGRQSSVKSNGAWARRSHRGLGKVVGRATMGGHPEYSSETPDREIER